MFPALKLILALLGVIVLLIVVLLGVGRILAPPDPSRKKRRSMPLEPWSHVTFSGGQDYVSADEKRASEEYGPTAMGGGLLNAICDEMNKQGFAIERPYEEDWGWCAEAVITDKGFLLCFGFVDDKLEQWLLAVKPSTRRALVEKDPDLTRLVQGVDDALRSLAGISNVRWHMTENWESGRVDAWRERPTIADID